MQPHVCNSICAIIHTFPSLSHSHLPTPVAFALALVHHIHTLPHASHPHIHEPTPAHVISPPSPLALLATPAFDLTPPRFGPDALKRGLVDELLTSDDLLVGMVHSGAEVYGLKYRTPPSSPLAAVLPGGTLPSDWRGVAIAALTRLAASSPAGASGLSEVLLRAQQEAVGGWGSDESSKYLAARPQGEVCAPSARVWGCLSEDCLSNELFGAG